ncbi:MAG: SAM-dependent methyltransferase [Gammaproteobacteria bacterium]
MSRDLLTFETHERLLAAARAGGGQIELSLDLGRSLCTVQVRPDGWRHGDNDYPLMQDCRERTIYYWSGAAFEPAARWSGALVKLVPTPWGAPTFEIDGIKMLPTAKISPWEDARLKVGAIRPQGRSVLDTCGGLGYFAAHCALAGAGRVHSFEISADVLWLREINPWSPRPGTAEGRGLTLEQGDIGTRIAQLGTASFDAVLHDPPRFGIAGDLYSQAFYAELARVLVRGGLLFHYTGTPNRLTSQRDVPAEVARRLQRAGFQTQFFADGVLARRKR